MRPAVEVGRDLRTCTACEEHLRPQSRCRETFVCCTCGRLRSRCFHLPGGIEAAGSECVDCADTRIYGVEVVQRWKRRYDLRRR